MFWLYFSVTLLDEMRTNLRKLLFPVVHLRGKFIAFQLELLPRRASMKNISELMIAPALNSAPSNFQGRQRSAPWLFRLFALAPPRLYAAPQAVRTRRDDGE